MAVPPTRTARFCRSAGKHRIRFFLWLRRRTQPTRASRRVPKAARASTGECPADSSCVNTKASSSAIDAPCAMFGEGVCAASPRERRADRHSDRCQLHQSSASRRRPRGGGGARRTPLEHTAAARSRNAPGGYRPDCFLVDAGADGSERRARSRCAEAGGPARGADAARSATASPAKGLWLCEAGADLSSRASHLHPTAHKTRGGGPALRLAEKRSLRVDLTIPSAAGVMRTPGANQLGNGVNRSSVANQCRRRSRALRDRFTPFADRVAQRSPDPTGPLRHELVLSFRSWRDAALRDQRQRAQHATMPSPGALSLQCVRSRKRSSSRLSATRESAATCGRKSAAASRLMRSV